MSDRWSDGQMLDHQMVRHPPINIRVHRDSTGGRRRPYAGSGRRRPAGVSQDCVSPGDAHLTETAPTSPTLRHPSSHSLQQQRRGDVPDQVHYPPVPGRLHYRCSLQPPPPPPPRPPYRVSVPPGVPWRSRHVTPRHVRLPICASCCPPGLQREREGRERERERKREGRGMGRGRGRRRGRGTWMGRGE